MFTVGLLRYRFPYMLTDTVETFTTSVIPVIVDDDRYADSGLSVGKPIDLSVHDPSRFAGTHCPQ